MRILLVNKFIFPKGGAETYTFDVGKMLEEHGHEVQYFGLENEKNIVGNRVDSYVTNMDFSQGIRANLNAPFRIIYSREARKKIRAVLDSNFENIKKNEDAAAYKEYFCKADRVVSISDKCVQVLQDNYPDMRNKFVFLPNLTSSVVLKNTAKAAIDEKFLKDIFNIVSVGRLTEAKGFDMAIDALKILKDHKVPVHWWIIGDGELRKCLEKQAKDNSVEEYLTFLGFKANPYPYMNKADLIVQTSRWEGKSVVLDEAKILGKPILATDYATVKDQVENGKEGVIVEMDAESIAREIEHLVEDESVLNGIRNYLMARNYGNQSEIVKYYKLFDQ